MFLASGRQILQYYFARYHQQTDWQTGMRQECTRSTDRCSARRALPGEIRSGPLADLALVREHGHRVAQAGQLGLLVGRQPVASASVNRGLLDPRADASKREGR